MVQYSIHKNRSWLKVSTAIFSRPLLAALVVGTSIHLFTFLNAYWVGMDYVADLLNDFAAQPVYGFGKFFVPYLVPAIVTYIGRLLSGHRQREIMGHFPEMNPDLVFKLDPQGHVEYTNPSVKSQLRRLDIGDDAAHMLLPRAYMTYVKQVCGQDKKIQISHAVDGVDLEYTFRGTEGSQSIFVSGHDSTRLYNLQRHLKESQSQIDRMMDFLGDALSDYGQEEFDLQCLHKGIISTLMQPHSAKPDLLVTHVFLAEFKSETLRGYIYQNTDHGIKKTDEEVVIDPAKETYAILQGVGHLTWSNWEDESGTLASFQDRFHPLVRDQIGIVERFATFNSGRIALIAFYQGRKLTELDAKVLKALAVYANGLQRISHEQYQTEKAFVYMVNSLARASEANDEDTGDHIIRINEYSRAIAEQMNLSDDFIHTIHYSAQMHDVGKIHVNPAILKKPGQLTDDEFKLMQSHPVYGAKILGASPRLAMAAEIALGHHEKYNGTGYPNGLSGEDIPLAARIVSIVDVYDALRQKRVYKPAFSHEKAISIMTKGDGRTDPLEFDPQVLKAFVAIEVEMARIFDSYQN